MKQQLKRLVSVALSLVVVFGAVRVPASAAGEVTSAGNFWSTAFNNWNKEDSAFGKTMTECIGLLTNACGSSEDGKHRGYIKRKKFPNESTDKTWIASCSSCSSEFEVMEDQFKQNYDQYTTQMKSQYGATNIGKDGTSIIYPTGWTYNDSFNNKPFVSYTKSEYPYAVGKGGVFMYSDLPPVFGFQRIESSPFIVPADGNYVINIPPPATDGAIDLNSISYCVDLNGSDGKRIVQKSFGNLQDFFKNGFSFSYGLSGGKQYSIKIWFSIQVPDKDNLYYFSFNRPSVSGGKLFPSDSTEASTNTTRPGSMSGNFGQLVNGNITQLENSNNIINETTNTYYNPITNTTSSITDWNYDYSDRSYNVTTNEGDKIYVTYGDENITIKEGDTIYNIYYMYPEDSGGGEPDPKPDPDPDPPGECVHTYTEEITTAPSCLSGGIKTFTCSKCQKTYTENLPVAGHNWAVDRTVNTTYDENGAVITEGYTIYKCTGCGNEYKDSEGKGPPAEEEEKPDPGGNIFTWLYDLITGFFGWIVSMFTVAVESIQLIISKVSGLLTSIPAMFSGFTAFLKDGFGFVPSEIIVIITLGVVTMVVVGVLKLLLK